MIRETEVCGIRALIAPGNGPLAAGLVFRVGCADEPLSRRGLTHLIEHLALHRHGLVEHDANAATGLSTTHFYTSGSEQTVVSYLTSVCDSLRDLPLERMAAEKTILRTEQASRPHDSLLVWRYGAVGFGAAGYPEWGLESITAEDVREWAATRFTRENAVLWIAGDVPEGLDLTLPSGAVHPLPAITSTLPVTPAYFAEGSGKVMLSAIVTRSARASLFSMVLERALFRALRTEDGNSYVVAAAYVPRDGEFATITALADALPEKQDAVLGGLLDVWTALRLGRVDAGELETLRDKAQTYLQRPETVTTMLSAEAVDVLCGRPRTSLADFRAELAAVTVEDLRDVAAQAMDTMLLQVPQGNRADWAGFAEAPMWSEKAIVGDEFPSLRNKDLKLVLGSDGVSLVSPQGVLTVLYGECVLMQCWPDGARRLIGSDAVSVTVEPNLYDVPAQAIAGIDELVPDGLKARQPARPPDRIPQRPTPPPPMAPTPKPSLLSSLSRPAKGRLALICGLTVAFLTAASVLSVYLTDHPDQVDTAFLWDTVMLWGLGALLGVRVGRTFLYLRKARAKL